MLVEKLTIEHGYNDFVLFGIISDVQEYKLAWRINKSLDLLLEMQDDLKIAFQKNKSLTVQYYLFDEMYCQTKLIKNKAIESEGIKIPYLVPELKNYPYLFLVSGELVDDLDTNSWLGILRQTPDIQYVNSINIIQIEKSVDNLIF
jgi:hypothetical protein